MKRYMELFMAVLLLLGSLFLSREGARLVSQQKKVIAGGYVVVLDAGHGGIDPGKVGVTGVLEKDINLQITLKLKSLLEAEDVKVILTRNSDEGLYNENDSNKKKSDMRQRLAIIESSGADLVVSIHQNSYHKEEVSGAQCFYHKSSAEGKKIAELLQKSFHKMDENNARQIQANTSYYLLKKTTVPAVIVECGFLSNYEDEKLLGNEQHQEKLVWAMHMAIMEYLNRKY